MFQIMDDKPNAGKAAKVTLGLQNSILVSSSDLILLVTELSSKIPDGKESKIIKTKIKKLVIVVNEEILKCLSEEKVARKGELLFKGRNTLSELLYWLNIINDLKLVEGELLAKTIKVALRLASELRRVNFN